MPFITTSYVPEEEVSYYQVELDGTTTEQPPESDGQGQARLKYDVTGVAPGPHTVRLSACNEWGCSEFSDPFVFTKALPSVPSGIGLSL